MTTLYMPSERISIRGLFSKPQLHKQSVQEPAHRKLICFGGKTYTALLERESDPAQPGIVNGSILELPGCNSWGKSEPEALAALHEALELYLEN